MKKILVIGSLNVDFVSYVPHLPKEGETISSYRFQKNYGGKGANQAVAAAMLGANVSMIGKVGKDEIGTSFIEELQASGVETAGIQQVDETTGMAFINVSSDGNNNIVLVPGANQMIQPEDIDLFLQQIIECDIVLMQLEIPLAVVEYVITLANKHNKTVFLNPAPALRLPKQILANIHTLIPNETELEFLTGMPIESEADIIKAGLYLRSIGVKRVLITVGERGSFVINEHGEFHIPAQRVKAVDSTAAGDSYIAAFIFGSMNGLNDVEAANFSSNVSAIVVTREGAQSSLPTIDEVKSTFERIKREGLRE